MPVRTRAHHANGGGALGVAVMTVTRTIRVAAGRFAPGHLGELTRHVPFELVDAVLAETRCTERRLRDLPSRVGMYFVLARGLFPKLSYRKVWGKLVAGLGGLRVPSPSEKALRDLRRRLRPAPVKALFEALAGPVAGPHTPGVRFGRFRTVAFDGCTSIKVADSDRNRSWLGKMKAALGVTGYPMVELMTLVETGTRGLLGAVFGPPARQGRGVTRRSRPDRLLGRTATTSRTAAGQLQPAPARKAGRPLSTLRRPSARRRPAPTIPDRVGAVVAGCRSQGDSR